jgi:putative ABC transport system permease protein
MTPALLGIALGLVGAIALSRFLSSLLFGIVSTDVMTYSGVAFLVAATALVSCYLPARRASHIDPAEALRTD